MKFAARIIALVTLLTFLAACSSTPNGSSAPPASTYIQNKGSDTIVNLALAWAEAYQNVLP